MLVLKTFRVLESEQGQQGEVSGGRCARAAKIFCISEMLTIVLVPRQLIEGALEGRE